MAAAEVSKGTSRKATARAGIWASGGLDRHGLEGATAESNAVEMNLKNRLQEAQEAGRCESGIAELT